MTIERYRDAVIDDLFDNNTFSSAFRSWLPRILEITDDFSDPKGIFDLGSSLSDIFRLTSSGHARGSSQGALSNAGFLWENLVTWYLNICFVGTRAVAVKWKKSLLPEFVRDTLSVWHDNYQTNSESDIVVLVFPEHYTPPTYTENAQFFEMVDADLRDDLGEVEIGVVQCKTNWRDNAQIPMLWDMVYLADQFRSQHVRVGANGLDLRSVKKFSYSFVTVPTGGDPKPGSMAVRRVEKLSGGNYWGKPTGKNVAKSLSEIFQRNFNSVFSGSVSKSIRQYQEGGADLQYRFVG